MEADEVVAQVDELRKHVHLEDTLRSIQSWNETEASESPRSSAKRRRPRVAPSPTTHALAKRGENVRAHKELTLANKCSPQVSPPLQRSSATVDRTQSAPKQGANQSSAILRNDSELPAKDDTIPEARSSTREFNKIHAMVNKNNVLINRKEAAAEQQRTNARRGLRAKIANVLVEVRRRQFLQEQQEKAKQFRDDRFARGLGPKPSLGDTSDHAFGLCPLDGDEKGMSSSVRAAIFRRSALLDALTLKELDMVRSKPEWFFSGPAVTAAVPATPSPLQHDGRASLATTGAISFASSDVEDLIDFFAVTDTEKNMDVHLYARKLRAQLTAVDGRRQIPGMSEVVDLRKTLCRGDESPAEEQPVIDDNSPVAPLEMMPCLGRHPQIRNDEVSPTLTKVKEVYKRKDEQDAKWVEDRKDAIARRLALNSFKAREQQRELLLQVFKQKELHKLRMLSAEERKSIIDAEDQENAEQQTISKIQRVYYALERSEKVKEDKRDQVSLSLEAWRTRVAAAGHNARRMECERLRDGERRHRAYNERLNAIGERRKVTVVSQSRKNDELKKRIQTSLSEQMAEQRRQETAAFVEEVQDKMESAALRRQRYQLGHRYGFTERAFGESALGFDVKHHPVAVDRRGEPWRRTAEAWDKLKDSFSMPELSAPRPLAHGGGLDEIASKIPTPLGTSASSPQHLSA